MSAARKQNTTVGAVHPDALAYTAGRDVELDRALVEADCIGSAAHATMLARMPIRPVLFTKSETRRLIDALVGIMRKGRQGTFRNSDG